MRHGQLTVRPDNNEDRHTCLAIRQIPISLTTFCFSSCKVSVLLAPFYVTLNDLQGYFTYYF